MITEEGKEIYVLFKQKAGSNHIAKPTSLSSIIEICKKHKPKRILEIGAGIGTITYAMLKYSKAHIDAYEQDPFCIGELYKNLAVYKDRYTHINTYRMLPPYRQYDLVVIDGGEDKEHDDQYSRTVWLFLSYLTFTKIVYIEGRRGLQRIQAKKALRKYATFRMIKHRDEWWNGKVFSGGLEIECFKSNSRIVRLLVYLFWEFLHGLNYVRYRIFRLIKNLLARD